MASLSVMLFSVAGGWGCVRVKKAKWGYIDIYVAGAKESSMSQHQSS